MQPTNHFTGLTMPVFSAFGWAGEEAALTFALSQLELFLEALYAGLPREALTFFPAHGLDRQSRSLFLANQDPAEKGVYLGFYARPMSLEIALTLVDKAALNKAYRSLLNQPENFFRQLEELGPEWGLRLQQMEYNPDSGQATHYQDVLKETVTKLEPAALVEAVERAAFLNGENPWVTPIYVSRRIDSEKVAAMSLGAVSVIGQDVVALLPIAKLLAGQARKPARARGRQAAKAAADPRPVDTTIRRPAEAANLEQFTYVAELKPLHIQRGFINLTPNHWPFFAHGARSETRDVVVHYGEQADRKSSVWRLMPNDQARIVLSPQVQHWLEDTFHPDDHIAVTATKISSDEIHVTLKAIE
ncbi:MAG: hypothetical protein ACRDHL_12120 [Candidatus Promineifilaceae bacterium]